MTEPKCRCWKPSVPQMDCPVHRDEVINTDEVPCDCKDGPCGWLHFAPTPVE